MKTKKHTYTFIAFISFTISSFAQTTDDVLSLLIQKGSITQADADSLRSDAAIKEQDAPKDKTFTVGAELRTRTEYRNGYRNLIPNGDTTAPAFFTNQRTRLLVTYEQKNRFILHTSVQDIRVWGQTDPRSNNATIQLFEGYAEVFIKPVFSIKLGRQKIALDNQRLFAENDWRANANAHDAVNFRYNGDKISSELIFAYNQTSSRNGASTANQAGGEPIFNTTYNPGFSTYKTLGVHYLKYKITDAFTLTTINAADGYQQAKSREGVYQRFTDGGRLEYEKGGFYATFSGYYQSGKNSVGKTLDAWYIQPEVKYTIPESFSVRLGAEVFSGDNGEKPSSLDHNFVALYGVAHRFNGNMDFFTNFPGDFNNAGLVNPYLFFTKNAGKKLVFRSDFHLFYSQNNFVNKVTVGTTTTSTTMDKYLGYENDLGVVYTPKPYIKIDLGFSYAIAEHSMAIIKKSGTADYTPTWAYLSVTFKPQLFKTAFK
jgi:hypothetical protein